MRSRKSRGGQWEAVYALDATVASAECTHLRQVAHSYALLHVMRCCIGMVQDTPGMPTRNRGERNDASSRSSARSRRNSDRGQ